MANWQVVFGEFLELFHQQQLPAAKEEGAMRAVRVDQNSKVVGLAAKNKLKLTIKLCKDQRSCGFKGKFSILLN